MGRAGFTVIVRCADPRIEPFFLDPALRVQLGLSAQREPLAESYISNVGGLLPLTGAEVPRLLHDAGLLMRLSGSAAGRIVLTAHSLCGGYEDAVAGAREDVRARQEDDARTSARRLRAELRNLAVDCYYLDTEALTVDRIAS